MKRAREIMIVAAMIMAIGFAVAYTTIDKMSLPTAAQYQNHTAYAAVYMATHKANANGCYNVRHQTAEEYLNDMIE